MKRQFQVKPLAPDRVDATFTIAQAAVPGLTLERWRQFAANAVPPGNAATAPGILVVENERGYIQGFCTYRLQRDMRHGLILAVDDLVAIDLINSDAVAAALVDALESTARRLGCSAVRLHMEESAGGTTSPVLYEFLKRSGHAVDAVRLVKPIDLVLH
jgi:hypothetical protein